MREPRLRVVGMRWWLGLAFAGVAALTAVAVVALLSARSEQAFRRYGKEFAVGNSVAAAEALKSDSTPNAVRRHAKLIADKQHLALFVFGRSGRAVSGSTSFGLSWKSVPKRNVALTTALSGFRYIEGRGDGSAFTVGLPIHGGAGSALVAYSLRPELRAQLGVVNNDYLQSALIASAVGVALGLLIATLTGRRLSRIAGAARAIGAGDFDVRVTSRFPDEVGSLASSIEQMRDRLKQLFRALEGDRDRLEELLDRLDEGVLLVDRELNVVFANDRAQGLLDAHGQLDAAGHDARIEGIMRLARELFALGLPGHLRLTSGSQVLLVSGIPPAEGGENAIIVVFDETQRERGERAQREFATNAAHELRTPLASIVTAVEMLQTGAKDDPDARDAFLEVIAREADRLTRLTRALLVLARAELRHEIPRMSSVAVAPLLEGVGAALPQRKDVSVIVDCAPTIEVSGDPDLLEQALSSVATNAMQHTTTGMVKLSGRNEDGAVVIEVSDTGRGIARVDRDRLFERFYRAAADNRDGFGLGLSIAREAVLTLGGEILLESELSVGTTVRIVLPRAEGTS